MGKAVYLILDLFIDSTWTLEKLEAFDNMWFRENSKVLIKLLASWTVLWIILLGLVDCALVPTKTWSSSLRNSIIWRV